jgi:hypothetical protein
MFASSYGRLATEADYLWFFDADGDGDVDKRDRNILRRSAKGTL